MDNPNREIQNQKQIEADRRATLDAYWEVSETPAGRRILADLDAQFGGNPFDATNPHATSFRCGQLWVVGYILRQIAEAQRSDPPEETPNG